MQYRPHCKIELSTYKERKLNYALEYLDPHMTTIYENCLFFTQNTSWSLVHEVQYNYTQITLVYRWRSQKGEVKSNKRKRGTINTKYM